MNLSEKILTFTGVVLIGTSIAVKDAEDIDVSSADKGKAVSIRQLVNAAAGVFAAEPVFV